MTEMDGIKRPGKQCSDHNLFRSSFVLQCSRRLIHDRTISLSNHLTDIPFALSPEPSKRFCQQGMFRLLQIGIALE